MGKTLSAAAEVAMHLTGQYPDWWPGRRYPSTTKWWAAGSNAETTRDNPQRLLLGESIDSPGTGMIPANCIHKITRARGVADAADTVMVGHVNGSESKLQFKSYEQNRRKWEGESLTGGVWFDEEPPMDVYTEGLTRTNATDGMAIITATPLLGMTEVIQMFYPIPETSDRALIQMDIWDAEHFSEEQRRKIVDSYKEYEREARAKGIPMLGSGRVFPVADSAIEVDPFPIPDHWPRLTGIDFGWDHPTAATAIAYDRDNDCVYVTSEYRVREEMPVVHARAVKSWGEWIPIAWPNDAYKHEPSSGMVLAHEYRKEGLNMLPEHATFRGGGNSVEAGCMEMLDRMRTGRWKVFTNCHLWMNEFHVYHRKDGLIVREGEDLICSSRYAMMMLRFARLQKRRNVSSVSPDWDPLEANQ